MENAARNISNDITAYPAANQQDRAEILSCIEEQKQAFTRAQTALNSLLADQTLSLTPTTVNVHEQVQPTAQPVTVVTPTQTIYYINGRPMIIQNGCYVPYVIPARPNYYPAVRHHKMPPVHRPHNHQPPAKREHRHRNR
jgi:hypothetical protein